MADAFPLDWPGDWERTPAHLRERPTYRVSDFRCIEELSHELRLLGAQQVVISSNIATKRDGTMYANQSASVDDPGVATVFPAYVDLLSRDHAGRTLEGGQPRSVFVIVGNTAGETTLKLSSDDGDRSFSVTIVDP